MMNLLFRTETHYLTPVHMGHEKMSYCPHHIQKVKESGEKTHTINHFTSPGDFPVTGRMGPLQSYILGSLTLAASGWKLVHYITVRGH